MRNGVSEQVILTREPGIREMAVNITRVSRWLVQLYCVLILLACTTTSTTGIKPDPKESAIDHTRLAAAYLDAGNLAVAQEEVELALASNPNHSDANYVYALVMLQLGRTAGADDYFRRALRSDPDNAPAAHDYGVYLCRLGRNKDSLRYFELAAGNPLFNRKELSLMRAGECMVEQDPETAERFLRAALDLNPRLQPALIQMASLSYDSGNYLQARAYIERYLGVTGGTAAGVYLAYQVENRLGAVTVAEEYRERLIRDFGDSDEASLVRNQFRPEGVDK